MHNAVQRWGSDAEVVAMHGLASLMQPCCFSWEVWEIVVGLKAE